MFRGWGCLTFSDETDLSCTHLADHDLEDVIITDMIITAASQPSVRPVFTLGLFPCPLVHGAMWYACSVPDVQCYMWGWLCCTLGQQRAVSWLPLEAAAAADSPALLCFL